VNISALLRIRRTRWGSASARSASRRCPHGDCKLELANRACGSLYHRRFVSAARQPIRRVVPAAQSFQSPSSNATSGAQRVAKTPTAAASVRAAASNMRQQVVPSERLRRPAFATPGCTPRGAERRNRSNRPHRLVARMPGLVWPASGMIPAPGCRPRDVLLHAPQASRRAEHRVARGLRFCVSAVIDVNIRTCVRQLELVRAAATHAPPPVGRSSRWRIHRPVSSPTD